MPINTEFFYPSSEFPGYTVVSYIDDDYLNLSKSHRTKLALARDNKITLERKRELDPMYYHRKVTAETTIAAARRARRNPRVATKLSYEPEYWENSSSYYDEKSCTHIENYYCKGCMHYVKPKLMIGTVCKHCADLVPTFGSQVWDPVMIDKRLRDEHGALIEKKRVRPKFSNEAVRLAKVAAADVYQIKPFDAEFIKIAVSKRVERGLTQEQLAHLVNRPVGDIKRFEAGQMQFEAALKSQLMWKLELSKSK